MERFDVSPIKINHLAFKLSNSGLQVPSPLCSVHVEHMRQGEELTFVCSTHCYGLLLIILKGKRISETNLSGF